MAPIATFKGNTKGIEKVKLFNKSQNLITSGHDGTIRVWDV